MKKFTRMAASIGLVAIISSLMVSTAFAGTFGDVPATAYYYTAVETMATDGVIDAAQENFMPTALYQRDQAAKVLVLAAGMTLVNPATPTFTDVPKTAWSYQYVETAAANQVVNGYASRPGYFGPGDPVTREQYAKMIVEAFGWELVNPATPTFTDVPKSNPMYQYVETAYHWSVINGMTATTFAPAANIIRGDAVLMAYRAKYEAEERTEADDDDDDDDDSAGFDLGGDTEGTIDDVELASADESSAAEGEEEVEVYAFDVTTSDDGPVQLQRVDFYFGENDVANASYKPWDYFDEISLTVNGEIVETIDTSTSSGWSAKDTNGPITSGVPPTNQYRLRFSGLEETLPSDETTPVALLVTMKASLDSDDEAAVWYVEATELRAMDETGYVTAYDDVGDLDKTATTMEEDFDLNAEDIAALELTENSNSPDGTVVEVDTDQPTNGFEIYAFDIEETEGIDVNITALTLNFTTTVSTTESNVMKKAHLLQDGTEVGVENMTSNGTVVFDNVDIDIAGDETSEFTVEVDFQDTNDGARYNEGTTVTVEVHSIDEMTDAGEYDEADIDVSGEGITSEAFELRTKGISIDVVSKATTINPVDGANNDIAEFTWVLDITAFGDNDVYINSDVAHFLTVDGGDVEILYAIEKSSGADLTAIGATISESDTDVTAATGDDTAYGAAYNGETFFKIAKGKTGTFTINLSGTNQTNSKQVRAYLSDIQWTVDEVTAATSKNAETAAMNSYTFQMQDNTKTDYKVIN